MLLESLKRIGFVTPGRVMPAITGSPWGYRRRARLAARFVPGKGRVLVGFSEKGSSWITDMRSCETLHPAVVSPARSVERTDRRVVARAAHSPGGGGRGGQCDRARVPRAGGADRRRISRRCGRFGRRHGVRVLLQRSGPGAITPVDPDQDGGDLWYEIAGTGLRMTFGPTDFIQVNADVNRRMIALALELLDPGPAHGIAGSVLRHR